MTPPPDGNGDHDSDALVDRMASALRIRVEPGWIDARDRIRSAALSATRRAWPLALSDSSNTYVSDQVLITLLRARIDAIDHVKAKSIFITPTDDHVDLVTIEISVDYPEPIATLADEVRQRCVDLVGGLLTAAPTGQPPPIDINVTTVDP